MSLVGCYLRRVARYALFVVVRCYSCDARFYLPPAGCVGGVCVFLIAACAFLFVVCALACGIHVLFTLCAVLLAERWTNQKQHPSN